MRNSNYAVHVLIDNYFKKNFVTKRKSNPLKYYYYYTSYCIIVFLEIRFKTLKVLIITTYRQFFVWRVLADTPKRVAIPARWRRWGIAYEFTKEGGKLSLKETNSRISSENDGEKRRWKTEETRRLVKAEMEAERRRGGRGELSSRGCKSWGDNVAFERVASFRAARTMERRILIFQIKGKFEIPTTFTKPLYFRSSFFLSLLQFLVFHSL